MASLAEYWSLPIEIRGKSVKPDDKIIIEIVPIEEDEDDD